MTVLVFLVSLLGAMALGMPIATSLLVCGVALMLHLGMFDAQILAQNLIGGADSFPLMAVPFFMLAIMPSVTGISVMQKRLAALGMQFADLPEGRLQGHTFHYSKSETPLSPLTRATTAEGREGEAIYRRRRLTASRPES